MPCFRVYTNVDVDRTTQIAFLKEASAMIAKELRKPEGYVTVAMIPNQCMLWGGKDVPCAQIYLMSLGGLTESVTSRISKEVQTLLEKYCKIPSDRYYIHYIDSEGYLIGYDGSTF